MTHSETPREHEQVVVVDNLFRPIIERRRQILQGTILAVLLAALVGGAYFARQATRRSAFVEFRPVFEGADQGKYPNGLPFAGTDVLDNSIVDRVFDNNHLETSCQRAAFHAGLAVLVDSPQLQFLNLEYQTRLSDSRLTTVDRDRLQGEYANRRASMESHYQLIWLQPVECSPVPQAILFKALGEILETWASDAQLKRGVLKPNTAVLTPAVFKRLAGSDENLLVRADLLRTAVARVLASIREVQTLPGADLVRGSDANVSFAEIRAELEDLIQARLDPLVSQAGRGLGRKAVGWVEQALQTATIRMDAAEQRAEAYRTALREYSGVTTAPASATNNVPRERQQNSSDVQSLTPQIDRTFIDRIVELSAANTTFRQEITRKTIEASVDAVERRAVVEQYRTLLTSMTKGDESLSTVDVDNALAQLTTQASTATRRFNEIFDEFSRVSLRAGPALYRVEQPPQATAVRAFGLRSLALVLLAVLFATPIILMIGILLRYHFQRLVGTIS